MTVENLPVADEGVSNPGVRYICIPDPLSSVWELAAWTRISRLWVWRVREGKERVRTRGWLRSIASCSPCLDRSISFVCICTGMYEPKEKCAPVTVVQAQQMFLPLLLGK